MIAIRILTAGVACLALAACGDRDGGEAVKEGAGRSAGADTPEPGVRKERVARAQQDPSAPPAFGFVELESGFTPDPHSIVLTAGGELPAADLGVDCLGMTAEAPDFDLYYTAGSYPLSIYVTSEEDTTLAINTPSGEWVCADDVDNLNPSVTFDTPDSGLYDIWVGAFDSYPEATLFITELEAGGGALGATPDLSGEPTYGVVDLETNFQPDPHDINLTAGGTLDASVLGGTCVGTIADRPDIGLNFTAGNYPLHIGAYSDEDTTLAVNLPDGTWVCDDDGGARGADPLVSFSKPMSGRYDIFVGTYGSDTVEATLSISEVELQ